MDVLIFNTIDGGNIELNNGLLTTSSGLDSAAYLSLFGGNYDDDGRPDNRATFWGNLTERDVNNKYISETQFLLKSIPATTGNLLRIKEAAARDLSWFIDSGTASEINVAVSMPALNTVSINIEILADGDTIKLQFLANWQDAT